MTKADVIITWLGEHEDFEGAPTEPRMPVADDLIETKEIVVPKLVEDVAKAD